MKTSLMIALILLSGCAGQTTVSVGVGKHLDTDVQSGAITDTTAATFELKHRHPSGFYVSYDHMSNPTRGAPFNNKYEYWTDTVYVGYEFTLRDTEK